MLPELTFWITEVGRRFMALAGCAFLALVFRYFLFRVGVGIASGKHGVGAARFQLLFANSAEFITHLAEWNGDGVNFKEQITDLLEEIVEVEGPDDVGQMRLLQCFHISAAGHLRNDIEDADAPAFFRGDGGEFAQSNESRAFETSYRHIGDNQGPLAVAELGKKQIRVGDNVDAPAFGIQDLANGRGVLGVLL